jgi:hypothetical protein
MGKDSERWEGDKRKTLLVGVDTNLETMTRRQRVSLCAAQKFIVVFVPSTGGSRNYMKCITFGGNGNKPYAWTIISG